MTEISEEELERQLRAKWLAGGKPKTAMTSMSEAALKATGSSVSRFWLTGEPGELELKKSRICPRKAAINKLANFTAGGGA